jgi:uncharacterized protein (DUF486 family)
MSENCFSWVKIFVLVFTVREIFLLSLTVLHNWVWKRRAIPVPNIAAVLTGFVICNLKLSFYFNFSVPEAQDSFQMFSHGYLKLKREVQPLSILIFFEIFFLI